MSSTLTTELEAVNICLATIGEAPVNSLTGTLPADVATAKSILDETRRKVCGQGYWFSQDKNVQSNLNANNEIILATNVLRAELTQPVYGINLVQRGIRLYNSFTQTYIFNTGAPKLDLTYLLEWDELPEQARSYITLRAARIFQARAVGAPDLDQAASRDEMEALRELKNADMDATNRNFFKSFPNLYRNRRAS